MNKQLLLSAIKKAIKILCEGRTFYDGYFDDYDNLGRIDKAIYILSEAIKNVK